MWKEDKVSQGFTLRKFLMESRMFPLMQDVMVRKMLYFSSEIAVPPATRSTDSNGKPGSKCQMEKTI